VNVASKKKLYLVQRLAWCTSHNEDLGRGVCQQHESAEGVPVRAFGTRVEAKRFAERLTAEARRELNPFQFTYQDIEAIMDWDDEELDTELRKRNLPTPTIGVHPTRGGDFIDWPRWYDEIADTLTVEEREGIWNLLDRLELYRVVEVEFLV
jgi:hypothetical protein